MAELTWDGKYKDGKKVAPPRITLPFQTVETVNESNADRMRIRSLFADGGETTEWRNRLIWGDKKYVLPSLLPELAGQVNLIYIDPPFDTGADFSFSASIPDDPETPGDQSQNFVKEPGVLEIKAYRDIWGGAKTHLDSYLKWFYETVALLYDLLADNGSIYVHLDWHVGHYAKAILDEVFGADNFRNEIVWKRSTIATNVSSQWRNSHDTLFLYSKGGNSIFNPQFGEHSESSRNHYSQSDERGAFQPAPLLVSGRRNGETGSVWRGIDPNSLGKSGMHWIRKPSALEEMDAQGLIYWGKEGTLPRMKFYLDQSKGRYLTDFWDDIALINSMANESANYSTQKPEALLERIIKASSNEGDLVLDCFCGSGTTAAVAEKLNRRWITCDLGRFAVHTARKRLLGIAEVRPFVVQNLGKYERQAWRAVEFGDDISRDNAERERAASAQRNYIEFILKLYRARPLDGYIWLHGVRNGRHVHVGGVDAPIADGDVKQIAAEFRRAVGSGEDAPTTNGVDVLGWDFAFEINESARQQAAAAGIDMAFKKIPHEVMEKRAADSGEIQFFELAALGVKTQISERTLTLSLSDFTISPDYVPADVQSQITHWEQLIDYWAIDWSNAGTLGGDTFHNQWQSYRTRAQKSLERSAKHIYDAPGNYSVVVKVIDILGNDTTKTLKVKIA